MIVVDTDNKTTPADGLAPAPKVVTEQRLTKTVIRRRAKTAVEEPTPPIEVAAPPPVAPVDEVPTPVEVAPPPEVAIEEPAPEPAIEEPTQAVVEGGPQAEAVTPAPVEDSNYLTRYKRIKVMSASGQGAGNIQGPKVVTPAPPPSARDVPVGSPSMAGLGRREIIEIRDFHKPKGKGKKRLVPGKKGKKTEITTPKASKRVIRISDAVTVGDLAKKMSVKVGELIQKLMGMGMMATINQAIDVDTASLVATEFGFEIENVALVPEDLLLEQEKTEEVSTAEDLKTRAPVVTVMGHVDHGKTSLLDAIRRTSVAQGEAGGITQSIGAYMVKTDTGKQVTFIDTPGHEAFTAMRARGAKVTDIVVLVVAADDGVMPQTKEAINHARSAKVPIVVAINKMDKPGANPEKIKKDLTEFNMVPEEWGGDTIYVPVSAKAGTGIPQLLEMVLLQTDVLDLKATPKKRAKGVVIEASLDKRRGSMITVLVQEGTLKPGDIVVAGDQFGRVRAMLDDKGERLREAGPSTPVEILGLPGIPSSGDTFAVVADERAAKQITELRQKMTRDKDLSKTSKVSLDDLYQKIEQGDLKELNVIVKGDTVGSVEVVTDTLSKLQSPKVVVKVIHGAVGGITESDIMLAKASGALVIGFNVRPDATAAMVAERQSIDLRFYDVIYELTDDVTKAMTGLLAPKKVEKVLGHLEVRQVFSIPKAGTIAGCLVTDGKVLRSSKVRLIRDSVPVYSGNIGSLKRFKDDAREVATGLECGLSIENFNDVKVGDQIEVFAVEEVAATLE